MKLSTRSRYGARLMVDLARHYREGPVQVGEIAKREGLSVKYLEQLIIPLKQAKLIKSVRGPKGGHMLAKSPDKITLGDIVRVLEGHAELVDCLKEPSLCDRSTNCVTRGAWEMATRAMYKELDGVSLSQMARDKEKKGK